MNAFFCFCVTDVHDQDVFAGMPEGQSGRWRLLLGEGRRAIPEQAVFLGASKVNEDILDRGFVKFELGRGIVRRDEFRRLFWQKKFVFNCSVI